MKRSSWLVWLALGCGDDGGSTATSIGTMTAGSAGETTGSSSATGDGSESSTAAAESSSSGGAPTSSSTGAEGGSSTTGIAGDPSYPPVDGGACPGDAVPTDLPGASICAPFCAGEGAMCPAAQTGDAVATCTPFERDGGSGQPCETHDACPMNEACGLEGTCVAVAFWACQLRCDAGQTCPDAMTCTSIGACGY